MVGIINKDNFKWIIIAVVLALSPLFYPRLTILIMATILAILAMSWDIFSGHVGYINLGHTFLVGIAGYTTGLLTYYIGVPLYVSIPIACVMAMVVGTLIILPAFRLRGIYFAMLTLCLPLLSTRIVGIGEMLPITGGKLGLFPLPAIETSIQTFYIILAIMLIIGYGLWRLSKSDMGFIFRAIMKDEEMVENAGLNSFKFKVLPFILSALIAGIGGSLWIHYMGTVNPNNTFSIFLLINIILAVMIGGKGTIIGGIFGSYAVIFFAEFLRPYAPGAQGVFILFAIGVSIVYFMPDGLLPKLLTLWKRASGWIKREKMKRDVRSGEG